MKLFRGKRVVLPGEESPVPACVFVNEEGVISQVTHGYNPPDSIQATEVGKHTAVLHEKCIMHFV